MKRILNFGAGPSILPVLVLEEASRAVLDWGGSGMSVLEASHRGKAYEKAHIDARERLLRLLGLDSKEYAAIFVGGGASLQFAMLPMNLLAPGKTADYAISGEWSQKAAKEARRFGTVHEASTSAASDFDRIEKRQSQTPGAAYLHITTNNTIEGTQWADLPDSQGAPLVADMSSDILCRTLDHSRLSLIYAGAQKNLGPAGVTIIVLRRSLLARANAELPTLLSYKTHVDSDSLYNTPPAFAVFVTGLVLKWIEAEGGLPALEKRNREKAAWIYAALDEFPDVYKPTVRAREDRSLMNITFRLKDATAEARFLTLAQAAGMEGLKGHRKVGGIRASVYNAFPAEGCAALADLLRKFARA